MGKTNAFLERYFWWMVGALGIAKLLLVADLPLHVGTGPHDDGLYISRAFALLTGQGFGSYDARLLCKLPGISLWVALVRVLGVPYLLSIQFLFVASGVYFIGALRKCGFGALGLLVVYFLYLINPVTFDWQWYRVMRDPLSVCLTSLLFSSLIYLFHASRLGKLAKRHLLVFTGCFAFSMILREEDKLLYAVLLIVVSLVVYQRWEGAFIETVKRNLKLLSLIFVTPILASLLLTSGLKSYVKHYYGLPILHDFGQGEFPKLVASMRSVKVTPRNRYVMVSQEALETLREKIPELRKVIDMLPSPHPFSHSCVRFGVCGEWANGWFPFWLKDAIYHAGHADSLTEMQQFCRQSRLAIERACESGDLVCEKSGGGLIPSFHLRWSRALVQEGFRVLQMMAAPGFRLEEPVAYFNEPKSFGPLVQESTLTHFYRTKNEKQHWKGYPKELRFSLEYWLRYPKVAVSEEYGLETGLRGAKTHFEAHGREEGRSWETKASEGYPQYKNKLLAPLRAFFLNGFSRYDWVLLCLAVFCFLVRFACLKATPYTAFHWAASVFLVYSLFRAMALSYVSVYMGYLDDRLYFSTYVWLMALCAAFVVETVGLREPLREGFRKVGWWK